MSPTPASATPKDELLKRYEQAKAMLPDDLPEAPSAAMRERIMQAARNNATPTAIISIAPRAVSVKAIGSKSLNVTPLSLDNAAPDETTPAANDSFWNIRAVASLAVMGLSALLWWQFENGTPEEQQAVKSAQPAAVAAPAPAPSTAPFTSTESHQANSEKPTVATPTQPQPQAQPATAAPNIAARPAAKATTMDTADGIAPTAPTPKPSPQAEPPSQPLSVAGTTERARTLQAAPAQREEAPVESAIPAAPAPAPRPSPAAAPMARSAPNGVKVQPDAPLRQTYDTETTGQRAAVPSAAAAKSAAPSARAIIMSTEPLFKAIEQRNATALREALSQGTLPDARTAAGSPALTQAVIQRWAEGVRILLAAGADRNAKNNKGHIAADVALELDDREIIELFKTAR